MLDLVIKNATIVDGTGSPPYAGSLGVRDGRIVALGDVDEPATRVVDADGLALAPGIIDPHTHYDAQLTWDPYADPSTSLGVTTVIIGNCGFTLVPCKPDDRDLMMRNLTQVEGMSLPALREGLQWDFESFAEYLDALGRRGTVPNVAAFVGHSGIRTYVLGPDATKRPATDDEIDRMSELVREAMSAGAIGFASSSMEQHNGEGGIPMPSRLADEREMRALLRTMGEDGRGIFMLTKGEKMGIPILEELASASGRPVMMAALLHNDTVPNEVFDQLSQIEAARSRGNVIYGQVACTPLTMEFTLAGPYVFGELASWKPAFKASPPELRRIYADPAFRRAVKNEVETDKRYLFNGEWERFFVVEVARPHFRHFENRSIVDLGRELGKHPLDWFLDFALDEDLRTSFAGHMLNVNENAVGKLLMHPATSIGLSDAGAHLTFFCDAGFGLHLLGHWSRDLGVMPLESAVKKLTGDLAQVYGIPDRGVLREGAAADMILFDPSTVGRGEKRRVFDLPTGAPRLTTDPTGLHGVWINGTRIADEGGLQRNGVRPGAVLRHFAS